MADLRFKKNVMCCFLVLSWLQFSVIVNTYFMNFICGVLVWLTTMVSIILTHLTIESNIKVKWFQNFTSQAVKERGIHKCCPRFSFLSSEQLFCHWTSGESIRYSKRLIVSDLVGLSTFYICVKTWSLAIVLPVRWNVSQTRRSDLYPGWYWTLILSTGCINSVKKLDAENCEIMTLALPRWWLAWLPVPSKNSQIFLFTYEVPFIAILKCVRVLLIVSL